MKTFLPFIALAFVAASCSTAYKSGQTPDDVYFSPARPQQDEYVRTEKKDNRQYRNNDNDRYNNNYEDEDDRYLRMKVRNRQRWSALDDNDWYSYSPYPGGRFNGGYSGVNLYFGSPWNPYSAWNPYGYWNSYSNWNYQYNPYAYYSPFGNSFGNHYGNWYGSPYFGNKVIVVNPRQSYNRPSYNRPRTSNMGVYNTPRTNSNRRGTYTQPSNNNSQYSRPGRNVGSELRNIFDDNNSSGNRSSSSPSYSPSRPSSNNNPGSSGSSNSGSSGNSRGSGGNASPRRF